MRIELEWIGYSILTGLGATLVMDLWALFGRRCFGIPSLNYAMVGRWVGHLRQGCFTHESIVKAEPVRGEAIIGWMTHYGTGIVFAALFLMIAGREWMQRPALFPAVFFGVFSVIAPFFILQPGMGAGIAASKMPQPNTMRWRSLMAHTSFGLGLYLTSWFLAFLFH